MEQDNSMTDIEYNAFIEHLKSSEIYKKVIIRRGYKVVDLEGDMASEDNDYQHEGSFFYKNGQNYKVYETKEVKVKGYFDGKTRRFPK